MKLFHRETRPTDREHPWDRAALLDIPLLALGVTLVVELFNHKSFTTGMGTFLTFLRENPLAFLVNALIILITLAPALFLRRRVFWCTLVSAVWLISGAVNGFILLNRMTPFTAADLTVLNSGLDTLPNYLSTKYIILLAAALLAALAGLVLLFWKGPKSNVGLRRRVVTGLLALAVTGGALGGSWALAFHFHQLSKVFSNLAFAYEDYGFAYGFLQTSLNKGIRRPASYSAQKISGIREQVAKGLAEKGETEAQTDVNVIFVQLESFIDPAEIQGLELSENPVPNWTALTAQYASGYLTVPVVGAGTANTECEVLTGMSTRFFGPGEYPYKTCLMDQTVETVVYDLKENGYATHAIHNHYATFYGRNKVYANLGFDDFTSLEYMPKVQTTPKNWAKDGVLTGEIKKVLDVTEGQPDLVFTVSVQGHGKYPTEKVLEDPAIKVLSCPNEEYHYAMEYYVNQIHEMDAFVGGLVEMLSQREEKTVLVLYGDHLPSLDLEATDMASGSLYRTNYVIWDNFGLQQQDGDLTAYQLSAAVLSRLNITTGEMNAFHQTCREIPGYRTDLKLLQYDVLYGQDYLYDGGTPYEATELKMGVAPITIRTLSHSGKAWYISGQNFTPYCKVTVDGEILKTIYMSPTLLQVVEDPGTTSVEDLSISVVDKHKEILSDTE